MSTAPVTLLFTDLVDSTALLQWVGAEGAQRVLHAHRQLLHEALAGHGGREVKWLGDGLLTTFESVAEGVRCAVTMAQRARRPIAAAEPQRPGELLHRRLDLLARLLLPPQVVAALSLRQLGAQVAEPARVGGLRRGVEQRERPVGGFVSPVGTDQVEDTRGARGQRANIEAIRGLSDHRRLTRTARWRGSRPLPER